MQNYQELEDNISPLVTKNQSNMGVVRDIWKPTFGENSTFAYFRKDVLDKAQKVGIKIDKRLTEYKKKDIIELVEKINKLPVTSARQIIKKVDEMNYFTTKKYIVKLAKDLGLETKKFNKITKNDVENLQKQINKKVPGSNWKYITKERFSLVSKAIDNEKQAQKIKAVSNDEKLSNIVFSKIKIYGTKKMSMISSEHKFGNYSMYKITPIGQPLINSSIALDTIPITIKKMKKEIFKIAKKLQKNTKSKLMFQLFIKDGEKKTYFSEFVPIDSGVFSLGFYSLPMFRYENQNRSPYGIKYINMHVGTITRFGGADLPVKNIDSESEDEDIVIKRNEKIAEKQKHIDHVPRSKSTRLNSSHVKRSRMPSSA